MMQPTKQMTVSRSSDRHMSGPSALGGKRPRMSPPLSPHVAPPCVLRAASAGASPAPSTPSAATLSIEFTNNLDDLPCRFLTAESTPLPASPPTPMSSGYATSPAGNPPNQQLSEWELTLQRWTRRLLTRQDFLHLHAASNALFILGGIPLEVITNVQWLVGAREELWYPSNPLLLGGMMAVTGVATVSGLMLTNENRKGAEKVLFMAYGLQTFQALVYLFWTSPIFPELLRCSSVDFMLGLAGLTYNAYTLATLEEHKQEALACRNKVKRIGDASPSSPAPGVVADRLLDNDAYQWLMYWLPNIPGPVFTLFISLVLMHSGSGWLPHFTKEHPEYLAAAWHITMTTTLAGHLGMFAVTLRDKKLISQDVEMLLTGMPNLISLVFTAAVWMHYPWLIQPHAFGF